MCDELFQSFPNCYYIIIIWASEKHIVNYKSVFAEGMSTCNISLLIVIDKGLFLENTFLKLPSSVLGPGLGAGAVTPDT